MEENIRFEILSGPTRGMVEVGGAPGATAFTLLDVTAGRVAYKHREIGSALDDFTYKIISDTIHIYKIDHYFYKCVRFMHQV